MELQKVQLECEIQFDCDQIVDQDVVLENQVQEVDDGIYVGFCYGDRVIVMMILDSIVFMSEGLGIGWWDVVF